MNGDGEQVTRGFQNMEIGSRASVEISHAYHVTSEMVIFDENTKQPINRPNWEKLLWNLADDPFFDGETLLGAPCVFFTTTLRDNTYPEGTMYPRNGQQGKYYWRVKVPMTYFNEHKIIYVHKEGTQVRLLLLPNKQAEGIAQQKLQELNADRYLRRAEIGRDVQYYSNDYSNESSRYFVNFVVCEDIDLTAYGVEWDYVEHTMNKRGVPNRDKLRDHLLDIVLKKPFFV